MSNVQMMRDLYQAVGQGNVPTFVGALDPEVRWHQAEGNPYDPEGQQYLDTGQVQDVQGVS